MSPASLTSALLSEKPAEPRRQGPVAWSRQWCDSLVSRVVALSTRNASPIWCNAGRYQPSLGDQAGAASGGGSGSTGRGLVGRPFLACVGRLFLACDVRPLLECS